jgi:hypothetical protein
LRRGSADAISSSQWAKAGYGTTGKANQADLYRALFPITSPLHRQKGLFMDEKVDYFIYIQEGHML